MTKYMVSYDLMTQGQNYTDLIKRIKSYGWAKPAKSTFIIESSDSTTAVRDYLESVIDSNDKLIVVRLEGMWAVSDGVSDDVKRWLHNNM